MQPTISYQSPAFSWLPPLAVMALVWSLLPGVLPLFQFQAETWDWVRAWQGLRFDLAVASISFHAIGAFCVGFAFLFWLGLVRSTASVLSGLGIYCGLLLLYVLVALLSDFEGAVSVMRDVLPSLFIGLTHGAVVGVLLSRWHGARSWAAKLPSQTTVLRFWPGFVAMPFVLALLPLSGDSSLSQPAFGAFFDVPERFYQLIRALILWLPVGVIVAFAGHGHALRIWALAGLATLPWVANTSLLDLPWREWMNLLAALPGLAGGLWLAERGGFTQHATAMSVTREMSSARVEWSRPATHRSPPTAAAPDVAVSNPGVIGWKRPGVVSMAIALLLLLGVLTSLADFPLWPLALGAGLLVYGVLLWFQPLAWLLVVPIALPLLELAPWSGRFFLDEFDLLLAVTVAVSLLRGRPRSALSWPPLARTFAMLFFGLALIAAARGIAALPALDANVFSNYWSSYNGLRVAKGFVWAASFLFLARLTCLDLDRFTRWLGIGMGLGVLSVGLLGIWERWLYSGLGEVAATYHSVGPFSGMHTGGAHLEAYLAATLPFLWLGMRHWRSLALTAPLLALATYVLIYTALPEGAWVFGVSFIVLAAGSARIAWLSSQWRVHWVPMLLWAIAATTVVGGSYFQQKMLPSADNVISRQTDSRHALAMADDGLGTTLFGMGLGSYPRVFLERAAAENRPSTYGYIASRTGQALRLGTGAKLDYTQRIPITPNTQYRLQVDARAEAARASLETSICERWMLNSSGCVSVRIDVPDDGTWRRYESAIESGDVGTGSPLNHFPTEFALANAAEAGLLEIDNVRLFDANGRDLLRNGDFEASGDHWFFKTSSALPWHVGNVWGHLVFEQGWLGLLAFVALAVLALVRTAKAAWQGQQLAWVLLACLIGLFGIGLFTSLLDTPRLAMLLLGFMLLAVAPPWVARVTPKRRTRRSSRFATKPAAKVASIH